MGQIISDIKYKDYNSLSEEDKEVFKELLESVNSNKNLCGINPLKDDFWFLTWKQVETLREDVQEQRLEDVIKLVYSVDEEFIFECQVIKIISSYKWIISELERIAEIEKYELGDSKPDPKEIAAGIDNFKELGYYNSLHLLSNGDPEKEERIFEMEYWRIFRNLKTRNMKRDFEKAYNEQK